MALWRALLCVMMLLVSAAPAHAQLSVSLLTGMNFGLMEFSNPVSGHLTMGSNGVLTYPSNLNGSGTGTAGQVQIGGTTGDNVSIACDANATLANGGDSLTLSPIVLSVGSGVSYGAGLACAGTGVATTTHTISATSGDNVIFIGGRLQTSGENLDSGSYATGSGGGMSFAIRVLVI